MRKIVLALAVCASMLMGACTRIETGEVGLRRGFDKQINPTELQAGSINQTLIGEVLTFPIREIAVDVADKKPVAADDVPLKDFDFLLIYNVNPSSVSKLFTEKSKNFHRVIDGDTVLMYNYMETIANAAAQKAVRKHKSLAMNDNRAKIEADIRAEMEAVLKSEEMDKDLMISQVQMKAAIPADSIVQSAALAVSRENETRAKVAEKATAQIEAERIAILNSNAGAINYMNAQANQTIANAVAAGKVNTIILPYDFKGIVNAGNK